MRNLRIVYDNQDLRVTVSIGIAEMGIADDAASWLRRADSALYRAKAEGRNRMFQAPNL
jgi:diguanylate cyclase (GGDEF)-like protein